MKKILYLCLCAVPFIFASCATLDIVETVMSVSSDISQTKNIKSNKADTAEVIVKTVTSEKVILSVTNAFENLSPEDEYIIGRAVASSVLGTYKLYENRSATRYVNKICSVLVANSSKPYLYKGYFVAILDTDEVNALSTPGGHIFITRGLLECAESEDALAAVIAHEVAHIQLEHPMEAIRTSRVLTAAADISSEISSNKKNYSSETLKKFEQTRTQVVTTLIQTGFSQTQEFNADETAMKLMTASGYNPECMLDLLEILRNNPAKKTGWAKTHPAPEDRIREAGKYTKKNKFKGASKEVRQPRFNNVKNKF